jgi:outer membrane biogenesis lipoprotein LolB
VTTPALLILFAGSLLAGACAPKRVTLPTDAGMPLPDAAAVHEDLTRTCRNARTLTAELALAGRAGDERLRGRLVAGFQAPASMRLEGVAPFGPPAFILAAAGPRVVLWLPRDARVLRGDDAGRVLGALTGVTLGAADLQAILTGCVVPEPKVTAGRVHGNGWASIDLDGGAVLYLARNAGRWELRAARRDQWQVEYTAWSGGYPRSVALRSADAAARVDLTATVNQLEANIDIPAEAFTVDVPADAATVTLDELRDAGPLREPAK